MTATERLARAAYSLGWLAALPLAFVYLWWRGRRQPDYRRHLRERLGCYAAVSAGPRPVWLHLVSVGETRGAQPLIEAIQAAHPGVPLLLTHMTPTGRDAARALYPGTASVYLPYDHPWLVRRFLRHFRPRAGVVMETELWPNLIHEARTAGIGVAIVNARLSDRSLRKGERFGVLIRPALRRLSLLLAQTPADAGRLERLGRAPDAVTGNLKFDVAPDPSLSAIGRGWRARLGAAPLVMLASSRDGEEAAVLEAWTAVRDVGRPHAGSGAGAPAAPRLCIVPRHPQRFDEVAEILSARGGVRRRSADWAGADQPWLLGDSMGEMAAYYAMADLVVMGGSLLPFGGQNLIEPCAQGVPVIVGPYTHNFEQVTDLAIEAGAALRVADAAHAVARAIELLGQPERLDTMRDNALRFAGGHRGAAARTLQALAPVLSVD